MCDVVFRLNGLFIAGIYFSVDLFLWSRQRVFYTNNFLKVEFGGKLKLFSFWSIFIIYACGIATLTLSLAVDDKVVISQRCMTVSKPLQHTTIFCLSLFYVIMGQVTLFALFVHALRKTSSFSFKKSTQNCLKCFSFLNNKNTTRNRNDTAISQNNGGQPKIKEQTVSAITKIIQNTSVFAIFSLLMDFIITAIVLFVDVEKHSELSTLVRNVIESMKFLFVLFSFAKWRAMVTAPCQKRQ